MCVYIYEYSLQQRQSVWHYTTQQHGCQWLLWANIIAETADQKRYVMLDYAEHVLSCVCVCVCVFMVEQAPQGIIQDHTYGYLNHHTHPPIPHPPTSNTVYSMLNNTHKATPSNGGHEYAILDEKMRQDCMSQSSE